MKNHSALLSSHKKAVAYLFDKKFIMREFKELMPMYDRLVEYEGRRYLEAIGVSQNKKKPLPVNRIGKKSD